ncbi:MAG: hypothetical protein ACI9WU_001917 [Myxococcota bacterium]|jgi:hypothetical protein
MCRALSRVLAAGVACTLFLGCGEAPSGSGVTGPTAPSPDIPSPKDTPVITGLEVAIFDGAGPGEGDADPPEGEFGWPCDANTDCNSEWCVEGPDGDVCSKTCIDECPGGWDCKAIANTGTDVTYICVAPFVRLCWPCDDDVECQSAFAAPGARCVMSDRGGFCGIDCAGGSCPGGFVCEEVDLAEGGTVSQCVPEVGECACSDRAIALDLSTTCRNVAQVDGGAAPPLVCSGSRRCTANGLTECDAASPSPEVCDGADNDCNGLTDGADATDCVTWYPDTDGDGFGIGQGDCLCEDPGPGFGPGTGDCNDLNASVSPDSPEVCNFQDDNCDGAMDEEGALGCTAFYPDADSDGFGSEAEEQCICEGSIDGWIAEGGDCDDADPAIGPQSHETCDGKDNDCDGEVDEQNAEGCVVYYVDGDGDGFGADANFQCLCAPTTPYLADNPGDCNDLDPTVYPLAVETCNDKDDDCDGEADQDGTHGCGIFFADADKDGFGDPDDSRCFCVAKDVYTTTDATDCNDQSALAKPGGVETCDQLDNDCNLVIDDVLPGGDCLDYYVDNDKDTFGTGTPSCQCAPDGTFKVLQPGDCNDFDPTAFPGAQETCAPADENCNGTANEPGALGCVSFFQDQDGDGWGVGAAQCVCVDDPVFNATQTGDCYDLNTDARPGQTTWFTVERGDGSFDYDCNNSADRRWLQTGGDCGSWPGCSTDHGWSSASMPNCGVNGSYVTDCDWKAFGCDKESVARTQECH